jgi:hypothetical protein
VNRIFFTGGMLQGPKDGVATSSRMAIFKQLIKPN